ncbi:hypothetical protein J7384_04945 [Endozoicomonas sp. G2_1]|uniref:BufA2 family periplasmic bufferin-type metallophore n=1 Tax=Endozoicomonas sp. G2_1 TaxID=2821091 RepID=UPI001ADBF877|nr:hypothetical protein [Endozoicomonas sp. G2_1]MBO9489707.1 hypothetical protein [Endozoicomonas sp. G2_1]
MNKATKTHLSGAAMALAAATLAGCGATASTTETASAPAASSNTVEMVHCYDVNVCKGHNDCQTATNACGGQGSCKGTGFVGMPTKACKDVGGTVSDEWTGQIATADLVHCYGVNVCKGHNDCKTADNACAGHATCKGTGFVATTSKSCADIGGTVGK